MFATYHVERRPWQRARARRRLLSRAGARTYELWPPSRRRIATARSWTASPAWTPSTRPTVRTVRGPAGRRLAFLERRCRRSCPAERKGIRRCYTPEPSGWGCAARCFDPTRSPCLASARTPAAADCGMRPAPVVTWTQYTVRAMAWISVRFQKISPISPCPNGSNGQLRQFANVQSRKTTKNTSFSTLTGCSFQLATH